MDLEISDESSSNYGSIIQRPSIIPVEEGVHFKKNPSKMTESTATEILEELSSNDTHEQDKNISKIKTAVKDSDKMTDNTVNSGSFQCFECLEVFQDLSSLINHLFDHPKSNPMMCNHCGTGFINASQKKIHKARKNNQYEEMPFECDQCAMGFTTQYLLNFHKEGHKNANFLRCDICEKNFSSDAHAYVKHCRVHTNSKEKSPHHQRVPVCKEAVFSCSVCCLKYKTPSALFVHLKSHPGFRTYICFQCGMGFDNLDKYERRKHKDDHQKDEKYSDYQCKICKEGFLNSDLLLLHEYVHSKKNLFECYACHQDFKNGHNLYFHLYDPKVKCKAITSGNHNSEEMNNTTINADSFDNGGDYGVPLSCIDISTMSTGLIQRHRKDVFKCDYCEEEFTIFERLFFHLKAHGYKNFDICSVCGLGVKTELKLMKHKLYHNTQDEEFLYQCNICDMEFLYLDLLTLHVNVTHKGKSILYCEKCDKGFDLKGEYIKHFSGSMHTALKRRQKDVSLKYKHRKYNCNFCSQVFQCRKYVAVHVASHHFLTCHICKMKFKTLTEFKSHKKEHIEDYPFKCRFCGNIYGDENSLIHHINIHIKRQDKEFHVCTVCSRQFKDKQKLEEHKQDHNYKFCRNCGCKQSLNVDFQEHLKKCKTGKADLEENSENELEEVPKKRKYKKHQKKTNLKTVYVEGFLEKIYSNHKLKTIEIRNRKQALELVNDSDNIPSYDSSSPSSLNTIEPTEKSILLFHVDTEHNLSEKFHAQTKNKGISNAATRETRSENVACILDNEEANKSFAEQNEINLNSRKENNDSVETEVKHSMLNQCAITDKKTNYQKSPETHVNDFFSGKGNSYGHNVIDKKEADDTPKKGIESVKIPSDIRCNDSSQKPFILPLIKDGQIQCLLQYKLPELMNLPKQIQTSSLSTSIPSMSICSKSKQSISLLPHSLCETSHLKIPDAEKTEESPKKMKNSDTANTGNLFSETMNSDINSGIAQTKIGKQDADISKKFQCGKETLKILESEQNLHGDQEGMETVIITVNGERDVESSDIKSFIYPDSKENSLDSKPSHSIDCFDNENEKKILEKTTASPMKSNHPPWKVKFKKSKKGFKSKIRNKSEEEEHHPFSTDPLDVKAGQAKDQTNKSREENLKANVDPSTLTLDSNQSEDNEEVFICSQCDVKFSKYNHLIIHLFAFHKGVKPFICLTCGFGYLFNYGQDFKRKSRGHMQKHENENYPYKCGEKNCGQQFQNKKLKNLHTNMEHLNKSFLTCDLCDLDFQNYGQFTQPYFNHYKSCVKELMGSIKEKPSSVRKSNQFENQRQDDSNSAENNQVKRKNEMHSESLLEMQSDDNTQHATKVHIDIDLQNRQTDEKNYSQKNQIDFDVENNSAGTDNTHLLCNLHTIDIELHSHSVIRNVTQEKQKNYAVNSKLADGIHTQNCQPPAIKARNKSSMEYTKKMYTKIQEDTTVGEPVSTTERKSTRKRKASSKMVDFLEMKPKWARRVISTAENKKCIETGTKISRKTKKNGKNITSYCKKTQDKKEAVLNEEKALEDDKVEVIMTKANAILEEVKKMFPPPDLLDFGIKIADPGPVRNNGIFSCEICLNRFSSYQKLILHLTDHRGLIPLICLACGAGNNLSSHKGPIWKKNHLQKHQNEKLSYTCQVCSEKFAHSEFLDLHSKTHKGRQVLFCEHCGKDFAVGGFYRSHIKENHCPKLRKQTRINSIRENQISSINGLSSNENEATTRKNGDEGSHCSGEHNGGLKTSQNIKQERKMRTDEKMKKFNLLNNKFAKARNILTKQSVQKGINCQICKRFLKFGSIICEHSKSDYYKNAYICQTCGKIFSDKKSLSLHTKRKHSLKSLHCKICGSSFAMGVDFIKHLKVIHGKPLNEHMNFETNETIQDHTYMEKEMEIPIITNEMRFVPSVPSLIKSNQNLGISSFGLSSTSNYGDSSRHQVKIRSADFVIESNTNTSNQTVNTLSDSNNTDVSKVIQITPPDFNNVEKAKDFIIKQGNKNICKLCGKILHSRRPYHWKLHLLIHHGEKKYICSICNKGFGTERALRSHVGTVHQHQETKCRFCGKILTSRKGMNRHLKRVHKMEYVPEKNIQCYHCNECFSSLKDLAEHRLIYHSKFKCEICGQFLASSRGLRKHKERIHQKITQKNILHKTDHHMKSISKSFEENQKVETWEAVSSIQHLLKESPTKNVNSQQSPKLTIPLSSYYNTVAQQKVKSDNKTSTFVSLSPKRSLLQSHKVTLLSENKSLVSELKYVTPEKSSVSKSGTKSIQGAKNRSVSSCLDTTLSPSRTVPGSSSSNLFVPLEISATSSENFHQTVITDNDTVLEKSEPMKEMTSNMEDPSAVFGANLSENDVSTDEFFVCDECGRFCFNANALATHKRAYHNKKKFNCNFCGTVVNNINEASRHRQKCHKKIKYNSWCFTEVVSPKKLVPGSNSSYLKESLHMNMERNMYTLSNSAKHESQSDFLTIGEDKNVPIAIVENNSSGKEHFTVPLVNQKDVTEGHTQNQTLQDETILDNTVYEILIDKQDVDRDDSLGLGNFNRISDERVDEYLMDKNFETNSTNLNVEHTELQQLHTPSSNYDQNLDEDDDVDVDSGENGLENNGYRTLDMLDECQESIRDQENLAQTERKDEDCSKECLIYTATKVDFSPVKIDNMAASTDQMQIDKKSLVKNEIIMKPSIIVEDISALDKTSKTNAFTEKDKEETLTLKKKSTSNVSVSNNDKILQKYKSELHTISKQHLQLDKSTVMSKAQSIYKQNASADISSVTSKAKNLPKQYVPVENPDVTSKPGFITKGLLQTAALNKETPDSSTKMCLSVETTPLKNKTRVSNVNKKTKTLISSVQDSSIQCDPLDISPVKRTHKSLANKESKYKYVNKKQTDNPSIKCKPIGTCRSPILSEKAQSLHVPSLHDEENIENELMENSIIEGKCDKAVQTDHTNVSFLEENSKGKRKNRDMFGEPNKRIRSKTRTESIIRKICNKDALQNTCVYRLTKPENENQRENVNKNDEKTIHNVIDVPENLSKTFRNRIDVPDSKGEDYNTVVNLPEGVDQMDLHIVNLDAADKDVYLFFFVE